MIASSFHFHPSLIFIGKARILPLELSTVLGFSLIVRVEVNANESDKHSSL